MNPCLASKPSARGPLGQAGTEAPGVDLPVRALHHSRVSFTPNGKTVLVIDGSGATDIRLDLTEAGDRHYVVSAEWPFPADGLGAFRTVCPRTSQCQRISAPCA